MTNTTFTALIPTEKGLRLEVRTCERRLAAHDMDARQLVSLASRMMERAAEMVEASRTSG
jgi:hypothetical protein